jgi:pimeloyl-ACP methyl ester carboxylesterase
VRHTVRVAGGRTVTVESWGASDGVPIFLLHGTPGCRSGPRPRTSVLYRLGVRLISYDRPGYGESSRHCGRTIADAAADVRAIADDFGLPTFGVVGRSGGGPHALACAALMADRVDRAAALVSLAPADADGLDWYDGMAESNTRAYKDIDDGGAVIESRLARDAARLREDPQSLLTSLRPEIAGADQRIIKDVAIRRLLTETHAEALRHGIDGWIDDMRAFRRPWGFDVSAVTGPVLLWHGEDDAFSPVGHTCWLGEHLSKAIVHVEPGAAHFGAVEVLPRVLAWVKGNAWPESERLRVKVVQQSALSV